MATPAQSLVGANDVLIQPALPRANAFDVLPALHELLSRIDHHQAQADVAHANIAGSPANDNDEIGYADLTPLEPRELPNAVLSIKAQIRRTMKELEKLPDIDRTIQQQELEIADMERRIQQQQALVRRLAEAARVASEAG